MLSGPALNSYFSSSAISYSLQADVSMVRRRKEGRVWREGGLREIGSRLVQEFGHGLIFVCGLDAYCVK